MKWYVFSSECTLEGLYKTEFWSSLPQLAKQGKLQTLEELLGALRLMLESLDTFRWPQPQEFLEWTTLFLVEMPYVLGGEWALGIERHDKDTPWEHLITRKPLQFSEPLIRRQSNPQMHSHLRQ